MLASSLSVGGVLHGLDGKLAAELRTDVGECFEAHAAFGLWPSSPWPFVPSSPQTHAQLLRPLLRVVGARIGVVPRAA